MGELVNNAIKLFEQLSDNEIMEKYGMQMAKSYPSTVEIEALLILLEKRGLSYQGCELTINFLDLNSGPVKTIKTVKIQGEPLSEKIQIVA